MPTAPLNKFLTVCALSLVCLLSACSTVSPKVRAADAALRKPAQPRLGQPVNPLAAFSYLKREGSELLRQGQANTRLLAQAPPHTCRLRLAPACPRALSPTELGHNAELSTALITEWTIKGSRAECRFFGTGFFLTESGALVTCRHILDNAAAGRAYLVMTRDGRICPVRAVLAAGETNDVAILQVEGGGFTPLPVAAAAPVGSPVWVMSHPKGWLYTLTTGMVSGYVTWATQHGDGQTTWMTMTADFAGGSSGAAVLNDHGEVVGVASETHSLFSDPPQNLPQMVLKRCVPSAAVLDLIQPE